MSDREPGAPRARRTTHTRPAALRRFRSGQATTEYMLLVAVLIIGLLVAAYAFLPGFSEGVDGLGSDVQGLFSSGTQNGAGDMR